MRRRLPPAARLPVVSALAVSALAAWVLGTVPARAAVGLPQMDFANPLTTSQVVWGALIFVVLYVLLSRGALPKVASVLEERARTIGADLDAAKQAKLEADAAAEEVARATREAQASSAAQVAQAAAAAKAAAEAEAARATAVLEAQLAEAEARIQAARASAMAALHDVAMETTEALAGRLIGHVPDRSVVNAAVGAALAARKA
ncbi:MAG: F0F1 ATP synthase subunit B' [Rhodospirillales bacterium]|nr:F0F1 ATP synthase subunit B' [Rhodospirillales bacterium]